MTDQRTSTDARGNGSDEPAAAYIDELASRAAGLPADFAGDGPTSAPPATVADARRHLDEAWVHAAAGTQVPADARMRQVKRAVLLAMRPVTSHQVQFNQEVSVAVKELAVAVDGLLSRIDGSVDLVHAGTARVHAALATVEVTVDDLIDTTTRLEGIVEGLVARTDRLEAELAKERAETRVLRGRQDVVLRNAAGATSGKAEKKRQALLAGELDASAELLAEDLMEVTRGSRDEVQAEVAGFVADVQQLGKGTVLDLGFGRGEWLELLAANEVSARGVDTSERAVAAGRKRGLDVERDDAVLHATELEPSSVAAITGFHLVERLGPDALVQLLDHSLAALRPGGLLILSASNPTTLEVGAADVWLDPARRRPVHPRYLEALALARGFAEAELRWLDPADEALELHPDDLAGIAPARAAAITTQLNRMLAGPRSYAVLARKPGAAGHPSA